MADSTPAGAEPTVFVVDGDQPTRNSLSTLLAAFALKVRAFSGPGGFHRFYRAEMPGCLLLDVYMPRRSGIELYQQLLHEGKRLPVVFITAHADVGTAVDAMKAGAVDYLEKPLDQSTLVDRVGKAIALDAQWRAREARFAELARRIGRLTGRQRETLDLIRAGATNRAIATSLLITERAVEMRRSAIMRKLQVRSVAELIDLAATHRVLDDLRESAGQRPAPPPRHCAP